MQNYIKNKKSDCVGIFFKLYQINRKKKYWETFHNSEEIVKE